MISDRLFTDEVLGQVIEELDIMRKNSDLVHYPKEDGKVGNNLQFVRPLVMINDALSFGDTFFENVCEDFVRKGESCECMTERCR